MNKAENSTNAADPELINSVNLTTTAMANPSGWDSPNEIAPISHSQDLVALTQELQSSNSDLLKQVSILRDALAKSRKALEWHKRSPQEGCDEEGTCGNALHVCSANAPKKARSRSRESFTSQIQDTVTQEQVKSLFQELKTSDQTVQRQRILIETLTVQLESSQERVAQMEREFALTQQRYNEQACELVQTENTCRELRTRLSRQQSHTLQFKVALEKCLEVPLPSYQFLANTEELSNSSPSAAASPKAVGNFKNAPELPPLLLPKVEPIPPWASQLESVPLEDGEPSTDLEEPYPSEEEAQCQHLFSLFEAESEPVTVNSPEPMLPAEQSKASQRETASFNINANSPSPVVYPLRPPKGRKSLAAVELPTFSLSQT